MKSFFRRLSEVWDRFETIVGGLFLTLSVSIVVIEIFGRNLFSVSMIGADEIASFAVIWSVFFTASIGVKKNIHVRIDVLFLVLPNKAARLLDALGTALSLAFTSYLTYSGWALVQGRNDHDDVAPAALDSTVNHPRWRISAEHPTAAKINFLADLDRVSTTAAGTNMTATLSTILAALAGGMPVAFALGACGLIYLLLQDAAAPTLASQLFSSLNSSGLLAIPFFILAAEIMSRSGATIRLINLIDTLLRHTRGGLPVISVIATALFSSICGSSVATAAAIGTVLIPEMTKRGYDKLFSVGLIATAGGLGILIPPSVPLVVYGMVTETSIAALFAAGGIVGLLLTFVLALAAYVYARQSGVAPRPKASWAEIRKAFVAGIGVLLSPFIVLGGIYGGFFTPMEAAAVSCIYAILLSFSYGHSISSLFPILTSAASMSSVIMLILAGAQLFGYVITSERVPHEMFAFISALELTRTELIVAVMLFFIVAGMFLEVISMILIASAGWV